jgi:hypothetical protein
VLFLRYFSINPLTCCSSPFIKLNVIKFNLSDIRVSHVFSIFHFLSYFLLATVDVSLVVLNIHCTCNCHFLYARYHFLSAASGVDVGVWLVARYRILSTNACLELVLSIDTCYKLLKFCTSLRPCIHNRSQLGTSQIILHVDLFTYTVVFNWFFLILFVIKAAVIGSFNGVGECFNIILQIIRPIFILLVNFIDEAANVYCVLEGFAATHPT